MLEIKIIDTWTETETLKLNIDTDNEKIFIIEDNKKSELNFFNIKNASHMLSQSVVDEISDIKTRDANKMPKSFNYYNRFTSNLLNWILARVNNYEASQYKDIYTENKFYLINNYVEINNRRCKTFKFNIKDMYKDVITNEYKALISEI